MIFTYAQVRRWLKLSKSYESAEPYRLRGAENGHSSEWFEIVNREGVICGQVTPGQLMAAKLMHSGGCSNQNALHPDGQFSGAAECGCQSGRANE